MVIYRHQLIGGPNTVHPMYRNKDPIMNEVNDNKTQWIHRGIFTPKNSISPMMNTVPANPKQRKEH